MHDTESPEATATRLRRVVRLLARRLRPSPDGDRLSTAKLSVVGQIHRAGTLSPTELARREGVKLPTLTRLLAELEADGWLRREPDPNDGRRWCLRLTPQGQQRLVAAVQAVDVPLTDAIAGLDASQRRSLQQACALLERLDVALGAGPGCARPEEATHV